jgi:hypothetical protein
MKLAIGTALFVLLAGTMAYAQEQEKEKEKPAPQQEKKQEPAKEQPRAQEHQQQDRQQQEQRNAQEQQKDKQKVQAQQSEKERANAEKQQQQTEKQQQQTAKQQQVAKQQERVNAQQAQRDGGNHNARRIREEDYRSHFGREHAFRVTRSDNRRFNYGGYWFVYNDPWPAGWSYSDDVYVDEIDGEYYLIDPVHPGIRLLIIVAD